MCYQIQMADIWHPLVHWCECGESNSSAFTQRQETLAPFVSCFVAWNLISNYNKPSSTWDHLNNKAKVQILFDFMISALPGSQQPHAGRFMAPRNPLPRGAAGHMNHLERALPFLLDLTTNKGANPEINCFNSPLLRSLSRLLLSLCALLLDGMRQTNKSGGFRMSSGLFHFHSQLCLCKPVITEIRLNRAGRHLERLFGSFLWPP